MKTRLIHLLIGLIATSSLLLTNFPVDAQEPTAGLTSVTMNALPAQEPAGTSVDAIDAEIAAIEANSQLDDAQKGTLKELLLRAKQTLETAKAEQKQATQYAEAIGSVAEQSQALSKEVNDNDGLAPEVPKNATADSLSQRLASAKAELQIAQSKSTELASEPGRRRSRLAEIPTQLAQSERDLGGVKDQLSQPAAANESAAESRARQLLLKARSNELQAVIERLKKEQSAYQATTELLPLQQKVVGHQIDRLNQEIKLLQAALTDIQAQKARDTTAELQRTSDAVPESLRELAEKNLELAKLQTTLIAESTSKQQSVADIRSAVDEVKLELKTSEDRIESVGLTDALGLMFRERRQDFEELRIKYLPRAGLKQQIEEYQIDSFRLEDELDKLKRESSETESPSLKWESEDIAWGQLSEADAKWVLLKKRQKLIEDTLQTQNDVLQTMLAGDTQRRLLSLEIDRFNDFADTRLFWTRSAPAISIAELKEAPATLMWLTDSNNWKTAGTQILKTGESRPLQSLGLVILVLGIFYARPRLRRIIASDGKEAHHFNAAFRTTLHTLGATIIASAAWPVFFGVLSLLCLWTTGEPFTHGLGYGFGMTAIFIASREFLKDVCRNDGLAAAHFGWGDAVRKHLRRHLRWYSILGGIAIFFLVFYHEHPQILIRTFATRVCSTCLFIIIGVFHHVMLRGRSPLYPELVRANPGSLIFRWRRLIWAIAVLLPFFFGAMSLAGYLETTFRFGRSLQLSFLLLVLVIVLLGLLARWLTLHRRDIAREDAEDARQRQMAVDNASDTAKVANEAGIIIEDETKMDLPKLDQQTRQTVLVLASLIVFAGLAYIWSDIVPALAYFDENNLWSVGTGENVENVTLKDLIYALVSVAAGWFAIRNLPGMLELLVLSRMKLDGGARYAITTLLRYALFIVCALIVLSLLSVPYNQLGWLVAAASVGLGFGLQEIVANFVCGIILLLERPVRVGDVVTIDGTTGIVSRIQMRATTVTNWDRKELVVPNKDLITQKLLNWSLSNVVNRLTIEVGVAYGTDPNLVRKILQDTVARHPEILKDPPPLINFETFGDSSLNFVVRFYLPKLENRIEATHQVNTSIAKALEQAGISIPFPQRDVHMLKNADEPTSSL